MSPGPVDRVIRSTVTDADWVIAGRHPGRTLSATPRTATTATVTVRGVALSVLPGWRPAITQSASVTVERITRSTGPGLIRGGTSHV